VAYQYQFIETRNGTILKCHFEFSWIAGDEDAVWPEKTWINTGFKCYDELPFGQSTTNSKAIISNGGRITMTCIFPADGG
jgi:hypothetical protein